MSGAIGNSWSRAGLAFAPQSRASFPTGSEFPDITLSANSDAAKQTGTTNGQGDDRATTAAATSASTDLAMLTQFAKGMGNNAAHASFGVETVDRSGHVLAGASFDANGNLSVFGSGSADGTTSSVSMGFSAGNFGSTWASQTSGELARASYELTSLIGQSDEPAANPGIDRVV